MSDKKEISETLTAARSYLNHLEKLDLKIQNAEHQINDSSEETLRTIETTFNNLVNNITQFLLVRREQLIKKVQDTKAQSLGPLEECRSDISKRVDKTNQLIRDGEDLLLQQNKNLDDFNEKSTSLGSLPEIPELREVPFISFNFEPNAESELLDLCASFGEVCRIAPVQVSQTVEKPGAILVEWQVVENEERCVDIQEFRLQRAFGNVLKEPHLLVNFTDCYLGLESHFLVKDLRANQPYSFRVCCKFEGSSEWTQWSLPHVAKTGIKPFCWAPNEDFALANENKIAAPVRDNPAVLLSDGPQFSVGYSVEFTYLEFDGKCSTIGLTVPEENKQFALSSNGEIFINGKKKSTKLPEAAKGLKICFMCELIHNEKVRVNIETCDKQVTYDWEVNKSDPLYFFALLQSPGSKIMVE